MFLDMVFTLNMECDNYKDISFSEANFWIQYCFVALRPRSTAMVMAGRSVHLTTLFPGQA